MTLMVAVPCEHGCVLAADSQETITSPDGYDYRKTVQKMVPENMGAFQVIVAGCGNAYLIESFIARLKRRLDASSSVTSINGFVSVTENELVEFYSKDVKLCPDEDKDKTISMFFAATGDGQYGVWVQRYLTLIAVEKQQLLGWDESLYVNVIDRLCRPSMTMPQAILAAIYVLSVAEQTSNYVRGPMSVQIIKKQGIWQEEATYIQEMNERLNLYEKQVNEMFLSCADTSVSMKVLQGELQAFSTTVAALHREHIDRQIGKLTLDKIAHTDDPYPKFPLGTPVILNFNGAEEFGSAKMVHDPSAEELDECAKKAKDHFRGLGFTEYVIKRAADKYSLSVSHRFENRDDEHLGRKTRQELVAFLSDKELVEPMTEDVLLRFLDGGDLNQSVFYARPKAGGAPLTR